MAPVIGVAIATRNRPTMLATSVAAWRTLLPDTALLVVVDDASEPPAVGATFRFPANVGVARAKNRGIAELMDRGVDHLFLADDDTHPLVRGWWKPYVASPVPHLMHCWGRRRFVRDDGTHTIWSHPRGVLLYAERRVIDRVGGMRPEHGLYGSEHIEWSDRIHNAGLTPEPFMDVTGADRLWWCSDRVHPGQDSCLTPTQREKLRTAGRAVRASFAGSTDFVDYR